MINNTTKNNKIGNIVAFTLAMAPILSPYMLFEVGNSTLRLMDIPMLLLVSYILLCKRKTGLPNRELFIMLMCFFLLTLVSYLAPMHRRNLLLGIKVFMVWALYAFCVGYLWKVNQYEKFVIYATNIAIIGTILLIIQFIAVALGFSNFYDGRLPILELSKYDGWAGLIDTNTGNIRVHSFFQEPSYFGIYCLPILAHALKNERLKLAFFIFLGLIITSSLLSILGGLCVILCVLFTDKKPIRKVNLKFWIKILIISGIGIIALILLYTTSSSIQSVIDYSIRRANNIIYDLQGDRMGTTKIRLLGYINYFETYPVFFKIFGVGVNQYPLYLSQYNVMAYSSTLVTVLLNHGLVGLAVFTVWLMKIFFRSESGMKCFALIFIIICFIDYFWFNWYFFYILTWFLPFLSRKNKTLYFKRDYRCL